MYFTQAFYFEGLHFSTVDKSFNKAKQPHYKF